MTMVNSLVNKIEGNWEDIKGKIKTRWGKLTDDDLATISGSYDQLSGKLQELYGYTQDEIEEKLTIFSDKLNLQKIKSAMEEAQDKISETLVKAFETFKHKTDELQEGIYCYIKGNPMRSVGAAGAAVILSALAVKLFRRK